MFFTRLFRSLTLFALVCLLSLVPEFLGFHAGMNRSIGDLRMSLSPKVSNGQVIFVAVDARSLEEIGHWPWSRRWHAAILDRLIVGGATDILMDFDFAFPSDPDGDQALETALDRAGGSVMLAVFEQFSSVTGRQVRTVNAPIARFAERSWPALVNVTADADGLVRTYPFGSELAGQNLSSPGALMAGRMGTIGHTFEIDFSIRPETIKVVSAIDVINGVLPDRTFSGRAIVVGAASVELADQLSVPVHGVVPGPMVHALAAETLIRRLELHWLHPGAVVAILFGLLGVVRFGVGKSPWLVLPLGLIGVLLVEAGSLYLFRLESIQVPTGLLYPTLVGFGLWHLTITLHNHRRLLQKAHAETRNTANLLEQVFNDSSDGIVVLDADGHILHHSASAGKIFGSDAEGRLDLPEKMQLQCKDPPNATEVDDHLAARTIEIGRADKKKILEYRATPSRLTTPIGSGSGETITEITTMVVRDITRLIEQEQDIAYLSSYDERTGAMRRGAFLALLDMRLERERDTAVFALSLPRLKTVNVTLGRNVGDALLKEVVARLECSPLRLSSVARLGGTRFAFFTEGDVQTQEVQALTDCLLEDLSKPYALQEANAQVYALVGCSNVPGGSGLTGATALEQAEEALDAAKSTGKALMFYEHSAWEKQRRAREIERTMAEALAREEFHLLYQPQHRVEDGRLVGAEALLRWESPTLGFVNPEELIGIAESTGFIVPLGRWILERAARDTLTLPDDIKIAVNVSGIQLMQSSFSKDAIEILDRVGLPADRICLELTETVLLASTKTIVETMQDLSFSGFTWALDDFGTGFSSMEYLSKMPLDKIKLDKSFTMQLGVDPTARPILHSTSELCQGLGVKLLCEGVETEEQLAVLTEEGCAEVQGYYFGAPMRLERLIEEAGISSTGS